MKWVTHQTGALLGAIAMQAPLAALLMVIPGAILPDLVDLKVARLAKGARQRKLFNKVHRGPSHWFGWWFGLALLVLALPLPILLQDALAGLALGAFCHVIMDMLTPKGVPLFPIHSKLKLSTPLCATGTGGEYLFLGCMILAGILMFWHRLASLFP